MSKLKLIMIFIMIETILVGVATQLLIGVVDMMLALAIANVVAGILFIKILEGQKIRIFSSWHWIKKSGLAILVGFSSLFVFSIVISWLPSVDAVNQQEIEALKSVVPRSSMLFATVIAAPFAEELFFRGLWMKAIFPDKQLLGLIISSVVFSLLHNIGDMSVTSLITYFLLSTSIGLVYWKTQSIECAMLWHAINNLLAFMQMYQV